MNMMSSNRCGGLVALRIMPSALLAAACLLPSHVLAQTNRSGGHAWQGQMQCGVSWSGPADHSRTWTFEVASDTTNLRLRIVDQRAQGDPAPLADGETRTLTPRKARLEIAGLGASDIEVDSLPMSGGKVLHEAALGHVEALDALPDRFTISLAIDGAASRRLEFADFVAARAYLKRCLSPGS